MHRHVACARWAFDLNGWTPTLQQLSQAIIAIQPEERLRLIKFNFIEDLLSSLVGRLLMRKYVSDCTGMNYFEVEFARDVRGKPYWKQPLKPKFPHISFNVSHQGAFVVLAGVKEDNNNSNANVENAAIPSTAEAQASSEAAYVKFNSELVECDFGVGVDVMQIRYTGPKNIPEFFRILHNKFSEHEWRYIKRPQHNEFDQLKAFMRHWCLKEAYLKEMGVGITIDLRKISFTVDAKEELSTEPITSTRLHRNGISVKDCHFEEHMLQPKYCAAIVFRNCQPINREKFQILNFDHLLASITAGMNDITREKKIMSPNDEEIIEYCRNVLKKKHKSFV